MVRKGSGVRVPKRALCRCAAAPTLSCADDEPVAESVAWCRNRRALATLRTRIRGLPLWCGGIDGLENGGARTTLLVTPIPAVRSDMFTSIICATDGSTDTARGRGYAAKLTSEHGAQLHVVRAVEQPAAGRDIAGHVAGIARDSHADLIVVGTGRRCAVAGAVLGTVTQDLPVSPCPVPAPPRHCAAPIRARDTWVAGAGDTAG
jgi:hypothetical protein